jgi:hypothetical protein
MPPTDEELMNALETEAPPNPVPTPPAAPKKKDGQFSMWEFLSKVIGYGNCEIFGDTGSGKTKTCIQIALDCSSEGKKVLYVDTEGNLNSGNIDIIKQAKIDYRCIADGKDLYRLKKDTIIPYDLIIIDSATLTITGTWAEQKSNEHGDTLQRFQGMMYKFMVECLISKKHIVIITGQPTSTMMQSVPTIGPMGDKVNFMIKEIYYVRAPRDPNGFVTSRTMVAWRCRSFQDGTIITKITTKQFGADLDKDIMADLLKNL